MSQLSRLNSGYTFKGGGSLEVSVSDHYVDGGKSMQCKLITKDLFSVLHFLNLFHLLRHCLK